MYYVYDNAVSNSIGIFDSFEDAICFAINYCLKRKSFNLKFFSELFKNTIYTKNRNFLYEIANYLELNNHIHISNIIIKTPEIPKFDFNRIPEISNYLILNKNMFISNIGSFLLSQEEIEKIEKLLIFK